MAVTARLRRQIEKSAQQRTQMLAAISASADHAATRYDFRCPPSSLLQASLCFVKSTFGGSTLTRPEDRWSRPLSNAVLHGL